MSMQRGCLVIEVEPKQWYCVVAASEYDYDFVECTTYGPCTTSDEAFDRMHDRVCNPGGFNTIPNDRVTPELRQLVQRGQQVCNHWNCY